MKKVPSLESYGDIKAKNLKGNGKDVTDVDAVTLEGQSLADLDTRYVKDVDLIQKIQDAGFSSYPKPYFNNLSPLSIPPTQSRTITINGAFFKETIESMLVRFVRYSEEPLVDTNELPIHDESKVVREIQVNSLNFVNDSVMEVNVTGVNIHDTATYGTDAFELDVDGTTEIDNQYWLLLYNGNTRIFPNTFTVSSGDIYIPRAGLTTDIPEGDWENISGIADVSENGNLKITSEGSSGVYKLNNVNIPENADFELSFQLTVSEYSPNASFAYDIHAPEVSMKNLSTDDLILFGIIWLWDKDGIFDRRFSLSTSKPYNSQLATVRYLGYTTTTYWSIKRTNGVYYAKGSESTYTTVSGLNDNSALKFEFQSKYIDFENIILKVQE